MRHYTLKVCEDLITRYITEYQGKATVLNEGILGLGVIVLHSAPNKKSVVIRVRFLNNRSITHTIIRYNKLPKKYKLLIEKEFTLN